MGYCNNNQEQPYHLCKYAHTYEYKYEYEYDGFNPY